MLSVSQKGALACEPAGALPHAHTPRAAGGSHPSAIAGALQPGASSTGCWWSAGAVPVWVEGPGKGPVRRGRCTMPAPYLSHAKAVRVCRAGGCDHSPCLAGDKIPVTSARCTVLLAARTRTIRERFAASLCSEHPLGAPPRCTTPSGSPFWTDSGVLSQSQDTAKGVPKLAAVPAPRPSKSPRSQRTRQGHTGQSGNPRAIPKALRCHGRSRFQEDRLGFAWIFSACSLCCG